VKRERDHTARALAVGVGRSAQRGQAASPSHRGINRHRSRVGGASRVIRQLVVEPPALLPMSSSSADAARAPDPPDWFISGPSLDSIGQLRQQAARTEAVNTLQQIFPGTPVEELNKAIKAGGDLTTIVDRLLAAQFAEPEVSSANGHSSGAGSSSSSQAGPTRRVRFAAQLDIEQMQIDPGAGAGGGGSSSSGAMSRLSDEELSEQMASSGITAEPTAGSARNAAREAGAADSVALEGLLQHPGGLETLRSQPVAQLATGALNVSARIIKTNNELETGYLSEKVITRFVIEVHQLGIRWEVSRRYSEFHRFHELLSLQWSDLPPLPPKYMLSQDVADVAQRMMELDGYLRSLLASPAVALSPLVCTFLDAIDLQSFRMQMLPRLQQMEAADPDQGARPAAMPTPEEAPNGW
jgi:hypothetical protein